MRVRLFRPSGEYVETCRIEYALLYCERNKGYFFRTPYKDGGLFFGPFVPTWEAGKDFDASPRNEDEEDGPAL